MILDGENQGLDFYEGVGIALPQSLDPVDTQKLTAQTERYLLD